MKLTSVYDSLLSPKQSNIDIMSISMYYELLLVLFYTMCDKLIGYLLFCSSFNTNNLKQYSKSHYYSH